MSLKLLLTRRRRNEYVSFILHIKRRFSQCKELSIYIKYSKKKTIKTRLKKMSPEDCDREKNYFAFPNNISKLFRLAVTRLDKSHPNTDLKTFPTNTSPRHHF